MKCDELKSYYYYEDRVFTPATHTYRVYHADEVDAAIAELKAENERLKKQSSCTFSDDSLRVRQLKRKIADNSEKILELQKALDVALSEVYSLLDKIESLKASHYAESVDAGMRERRLRRTLWIARAERAKEHLWHEVNADGSPKDDYKGHDWVLVQLQEFGGFELIPRIAEYRRHLQRWVFIDEDYDTENTHTFRYLREQCKVIGWRFIDFAYYGKKFFVQQEINKNVERKCREKAEEYK